MTRRRTAIRLLLMAAIWVAPVGLQAARPFFGGAPRDFPPIIGLPSVEGELLVGLAPGASLPEIARAVGARAERSFAHGNVHLLRLQEGSVGLAVHTLKSTSGVTFAEPNWLRSLHEAPNDDGYSWKWDLHNEGTVCGVEDCATADADLDWQEAYDYLGSSANQSAVVAVLDTGIDASHPDLDDRATGGRDFLRGDAEPTDTYGHGTHVAGIALAETGNEVGAASVGYAADIRVMPLRVCDENGCPTSAIVDAIYYAVNAGANVINLSLGGRIGSAAEEQAIAYAWSQGLVVVASSGNDSRGRVSYPAAFALCLAVGSTDWHDGLASYSNKGNDLDVVAPGGAMSSYGDPGGIYSTMPTYDVYLTTAYAYSRDYDHLQGTSMAAPQVSGLAALLFAMGVPDKDGDGKVNDEIRDLIETTTDDLGKPGWDREFGWGRVNVYNAVRAASVSDEAPVVTIPQPPAGARVSGTVEVTAEAGDDRGVVTVEFFVDGSSIGLDGDSLGGWSAYWDTSTGLNGAHEVSAIAADTLGQKGSDAIVVTVENPSSSNVEVWSISPDSLRAGGEIDVIIRGAGFAAGADVTFEGGEGPAPQADNVTVGIDTIRATVSAKSGGPPRDSVWDLRVVNPGGAAGVLVGRFTVTP